MADPYSRIPFFFKERKHGEGHGNHHAEQQHHHPKDVHSHASDHEGDVAALGAIPDSIFEKHAEATNIELFYDLFFVANLTVFSMVKEINDKKTLSQYIGFFCILWFSWYQVSLYDVRFCKDSLFDRLCKLVQFGVMIGFATCGPNFNAGKVTENYGDSVASSSTELLEPYNGDWKTYKSMTLLMLVSRFVLVVQYVQGMLIFKSRPAYRGNVLPMLLIAGTELLAAAIYGLLFLAFRAELNNAYVAWYVVSIVETAIATFISAWFRKGISFKGTHLVQRMGLLTLIILGEGVMGLAERCQTLMKGRIFEFSGSTISDIFFSVTIVYFLYMLYFDWIVEHHDMGAIKQLIWAFLHFPLHLALVLTVAGTNQFVAFRAGIAKSNDVFNDIMDFNSTVQPDTALMATYMYNTTDYIMNNAMYGLKNAEQTFEMIDNWQKTYYAIGNFSIAGNYSHLEDAFNYISNAILNAVGFEASEELIHYVEDEALNNSYNLYRVAQLVYYYFYIACGVYVILTGVVAWLGKKNKNAAERIRLIISFFMGALLCILASLCAAAATIPIMISPWVLPLVGFLLAIIVVLDHAPLPATINFPWSKKKAAPAPVTTAGSSSTDVHKP